MSLNFLSKSGSSEEDTAEKLQNVVVITELRDTSMAVLCRTGLIP